MNNEDIRKATMAAHNPQGLINELVDEGERRNNPNRHFYLYAKNHYQIDDVFYDMKVIQGNYCGMPPQYVSDRDILNRLLSLVYLHVVIDRDSGLQQFVSFTSKFGANDDLRWKIQTCLSVLMTAEVKDIYYELGEPDPGILPLSSAPKAS